MAKVNRINLAIPSFEEVPALEVVVLDASNMNAHCTAVNSDSIAMSKQEEAEEPNENLPVVVTQVLPACSQGLTLILQYEGCPGAMQGTVNAEELGNSGG
jgi:hypothetical protein